MLRGAEKDSARLSGLAEARHVEEPAASPAGDNVFEFSLVFWAPSAERIKQETYRQQKSICGGTRGATRGGPAPPTLDAEMRWALRANDLASETSYAFEKTAVSPGVLERVRRLGAQLDLAATVAGAYEIELGAGFADGVYVPSLMAAVRVGR